MVEDKLVRRSFWVGEIACSSRAYHKNIYSLNVSFLKEEKKISNINKILMFSLFLNFQVLCCGKIRNTKIYFFEL